MVRRGGRGGSMMPATDTLHQLVMASDGAISGPELLMNMLAFSGHGLFTAVRELADPAHEPVVDIAGLGLGCHAPPLKRRCPRPPQNCQAAGGQAGGTPPPKIFR